MNTSDYEKFFELLDQIVGGFGNWQTKKNELAANADDSDISNLEELAEWFHEG